MREEWNDFKTGSWTKSIDVRNFIQTNYTPYEGDDSFLAGATEDTNKLWAEVSELFKKERENGGVLDAAPGPYICHLPGQNCVACAGSKTAVLHPLKGTFYSAAP